MDLLLRMPDATISKVDEWRMGGSRQDGIRLLVGAALVMLSDPPRLPPEEARLLASLSDQLLVLVGHPEMAVELVGQQGGETARRLRDRLVKMGRRDLQALIFWAARVAAGEEIRAIEEVGR